jgi:hypothetical protein
VGVGGEDRGLGHGGLGAGEGGAAGAEAEEHMGRIGRAGGACKCVAVQQSCLQNRAAFAKALLFTGCGDAVGWTGAADGRALAREGREAFRGG